MRFFALHGGQAPTGAFTQAAVDGTHNADRQYGLGYNSFNVAVNYREPHAFPVHSPAALAPSGVYTKTAIDGTHNASFQTGVGYWDSNFLLFDYPIWYRTLTSVLSFLGFSYAYIHSIYQLTWTAALSFSGSIRRALSRTLTAALPFVGLIRRGRIFLGNLSFSALHIPVHVYKRTLTANLRPTAEFISHWHQSYAFLFSSVLSFSGLWGKAYGKVFTPSLLFNLSPTQIPGLQLWLKADAIQASDGASITFWPDSSGNAFNAVAPATAPTFIGNGVNGKPSVRFNGTNNFMRTPSINVSQPDSIFVVGKCNSTATYGIWFNGTQQTPRQELQTQITSGNFLAGTGNNTWQDSINNTGAWHIFNAQFSANNVNLWVDGTSRIGGAVGADGIAQVDFGGIDWGGGFYMAGDIAEILVFTHYLSSAEQSVVNTYLGKKYGISVTGATTENILNKFTVRSAIAAAVSFIGSFVGHIIVLNQKLLTAALNFAGLLNTLRHHHNFATLTATLSFVGFFLPRYIYHRLLTAVLSFVGSFSTFKPTYFRVVTAALSFVGFFQRGPFFKLFRDILFFNQIPPQIPDLFIWLKADALQLNNGDPVTTWNDSSGRNFNATVVSGKTAPTFRTGVVNGKPVVRFNGINDALGTAFANLNQPDTLICVGKHTDYVNTYAIWFGGLGTPGKNFQTSENSWTNGIWFINANYTLQAPGNQSGAWHIFTAGFGGAANSYFGYGWIDGVQQWTPQNVGSSNFEDGMCFGYIQPLGGYTGNPYAMNGDIAEIIAYGHLITDSERRLLEGYLGAKYGISVPQGSDPSLFKTTLKTISAALDFLAEWIGHIPGHYLQTFASVLNFTGTFVAHTIGTTFVTLGATLNFSGLIDKSRTYFMYAALAFVGTIVELYEHFQVVFRSTLDFIGDWLYTPRNKGFEAVLSFSGFRRAHWFIPRVKTWAATLRFNANLSSFPPFHQIYQQALNATLSFLGLLETPHMLLEARLRLQGVLQKAWYRMRSLILIVLNLENQQLAFASEQEAKAAGFVNGQQLIGTTPTLITGLPTGRLNTLYIKNLDTTNTVKIAGDSSFTLFPQLIVPQMGILTATQNSTVWAIAINAPVMIEFIAS